MSIKENNIELKIYELLGIKYFKKAVFFVLEIAITPFTLEISRKERKKLIHTIPSNYTIKKGNGIQDLIDFKKMLLLNSSLHIICLFLCIPNFKSIFNGTANLTTYIRNTITILINLYCIMLQRYNHIRINKVLNKNKSNQIIKINKLKCNNQILNTVTYQLVNNKNNKEKITFDEFIENATLQQLTQYRKCLNYFIYNNNQLFYQQNPIFTLEKNKKLKLTINKK